MTKSVGSTVATGFSYTFIPPVAWVPVLCFPWEVRLGSAEGWTWTNHRAWWNTPGLDHGIRRRCWSHACWCRSPAHCESSAGRNASWVAAATARGFQSGWACRWCAPRRCVSPPWSGRRRASRRGSRRGSSCSRALVPGTETKGWRHYHPARERCTHCKRVVMEWLRQLRPLTHSFYSSNTTREEEDVACRGQRGDEAENQMR